LKILAIILIVMLAVVFVIAFLSFRRMRIKANSGQADRGGPNAEAARDAKFDPDRKRATGPGDD
jgi:hypothetical protein